MNIEETQKVNRLAKELLSHGIAASSQDAMARAEEMIHGKKTSEQKSAEAAEFRDNQEIRYLQNAVRQLSTDVAGLSKELLSLKESHSSLKQELASVKVQRPVAASPSSVQQEKLSSQQRPEQQPTGKERPFSEEDVAIDKVFYFGKK